MSGYRCGERAMPLGVFEREVLRCIASNRHPDSFGGGAPQCCIKRRIRRVHLVTSIVPRCDYARQVPGQGSLTRLRA